MKRKGKELWRRFRRLVWPICEWWWDAGVMAAQIVATLVMTGFMLLGGYTALCFMVYGFMQP